MKGICPSCHSSTIIADRVRCADRLWCDSEDACKFYMVQAQPGFQAAYDEIFPAPEGYNDRMVSQETRTQKADRRLFVGMQTVGMGKEGPR